MKLNAIRIAVAAVLAPATLAITPATAAEKFPQKPIRIIVPFLAGGAVDTTARLLAQGLDDKLGESIIVENRAGAGGTIGADAVAKADADGHTMLFTAQGPLVINPFLFENLPYDAQNDLDPISIVLEAPNVLAVAPESDIQELADLKQGRDGSDAPRTYATQGLGTTGHITGVMLENASGYPLQHIPYKGFGPVLTDVVGGRVDMLITDTFNIVPRTRSGELRAVAVAAAERSPALPDVPTFAEQGQPDVVAGPWFVLALPAGVPNDVKQTITQAVHEVAQSGELTERITDLGAVSRTTPNPDDAAEFVRSEYTRWGDAIREGGVQPAN